VGRVTIFSLVLLLAGCGATPAGFVAKKLIGGGGGPDIDANVNVGKTNTQSVGTNRVVDQTVRNAGKVEQSADEIRVKAEAVETVVVNEGPSPWMLLIYGLLMGFVIPSPAEIGRGILWLFRRKRKVTADV